MNSDLDFIENIASEQKTDLDDSLYTENIKFYPITAKCGQIRNNISLMLHLCTRSDPYVIVM